MKQVVFAMLRCKVIFLLLMVCYTTCHSQEKKEREQRIEKQDFPTKALDLMAPYLKDAKRIRYYRESDREKTSFECKFKRNRLLFSIEFDASGILEDVEFIIKKVDISNDSWNRINNHVEATYTNPRIKKIQQQYPSKKDSQEQILRDAFQNLLVPNINYELIVTSKGKNGFEEYELLFDSRGYFLKARKSLPQKYDHVLY